MPHPLRMFEPGRIYEITSRTIQGRFLLRPSPRVNEIIAGIIGRAQRLYRSVRVYGVVVLSNHITWLLSAESPEEIPRFIGYVNGNISMELGRLHDWPGKLWERPHRPIPILDNDALVRRMKYLLAQGCKEGLVRSPREWPGVSCVPTLAEGKSLTGTWFERDVETKARRRGKAIAEDEYTKRYEVRFAKLPCWETLTDEEYAAQVRQLVEDIEAEARTNRTSVVGKEKVCRSHPHHRPEELAHSPAPMCHTESSALRRAFRATYRAFVAAFREAAELLKQGVRSVRFPAYAFPPRLPMEVCADG